MTAMIRFYGTGILMSIALVGVSVVCPRWPEVFGIEVASRPRARGHEVSEPGRECQVFNARIDAKAQIISRLRAGELDLFEATAWFASVNREPADFVDNSWMVMPGDSNEEKMCRQVILWSKGCLTRSMPESELGLFIEKLEAQLSARLCERGRIELPDWR
jgi:hypothetical protein